MRSWRIGPTREGEWRQRLLADAATDYVAMGPSNSGRSLLSRRSSSRRATSASGGATRATDWSADKQHLVSLSEDHADNHETSELVACARWRASEIDPPTDAPQAPERQTEVKAEDLRPYLKGCSPYGADATY